MKSKPSAIVIGAGMGGLSSAIRLAIKGIDVTVVEQSDKPGGKLNEIRLGNYRFDAGPSLFTMPELIDELFELSGRPKGSFQYIQLNDICHYFYEDGTQFISSRDTHKMIQQWETLFKEDPQKLTSYYATVKKIYDITTPLFLNKSLHRIKSYVSWNVFISFLQLPFIQSHLSMAKLSKRFFKSNHLQQFANRFATYNGSNPYQAPGTLHLIAQVEQGGGAYYPEGGMYAITQRLHELALDLGVQFKWHTSAQKIVHADNKVRGVETNKGLHQADIIVSNADVYRTYKQLLKDLKAPEKILLQEKSSSALIFYWGIKKNFPSLGLHNIFFSNNYQAEFDCIWKEKQVSSDPTVYINITSKVTTNDAPDGSENWFVMINVPYNSGQDWTAIRKKARQDILKKLERILQTPIENYIEQEDYLDPIRIEERTGSHLGALYGNSSNNPMAAFFRHSNDSKKLKGLYFAGGSVHPGGGVPLANLSGKIAVDLITDDYGL